MSDYQNFILTEESVRAIVDTYRYFDVIYDEGSRLNEIPPFFRVVGYRSRWGRFWWNDFTLCVFGDLGKAWYFVHFLRQARKGRDISKLIQEVGISV